MQKNFKPHPNSFKNTFCVFNEVLSNEIEGLKKQFESKAGSAYYYTESGMYRVSNHWGRLANSKWRLIAMEPETPSKTKIGFARWNEFYPDNAEEKLYYIDVNYDKNTVTYQHKKNPEFDNKAILRTSFETTKKIKQIRNLQQLTSWAKHFDYESIDDLRKQIITELIFTEKTLDEIKREI
ncbi:hypothetical protein [Flavobacterium hibernum]|uniref:Uncharacterized protein n=1 Tax=Flavobacterium hibernum TaxID=37752 RepID=A0A0D0ENK3_9FLAO|nr:hypothetical protein [Flavobacterium hibernum]KIO54685.1 hypothetical protein IW18_01390 [Flavobacterium hibernum]OXA84755.1 hypothetical protein B0A73_19290 [Flavobacterium hibernum]PTT04276.1 hypothetical protein DBR27_09640 [Flavobacterium sp. HMWF030]STO18436.1 Uncharacterised protein [Flavobacterium hibernum]